MDDSSGRELEDSSLAGADVPDTVQWERLGLEGHAGLP